MLFGGHKALNDTMDDMLAAAIRRDNSFGTLVPDQKLRTGELCQSNGGQVTLCVKHSGF